MSQVFRNFKQFLVEKNIPHNEEGNGSIKIFPKDIDSAQDRSFVLATIDDEGIERVAIEDDYVVIADVPDEDNISFSMEVLRMAEDRILVKPQKRTEEETAVYSKDADKEKPNKGIVVRVGPGTNHVSMYLLATDKIIYGRWAGTPIAIDGEEYLIMRQSDTLMYEPSSEPPINF